MLIPIRALPALKLRLPSQANFFFLLLAKQNQDHLIAVCAQEAFGLLIFSDS
jgi:hypothetical protein